jgi:hypothetical protein
MINIEQVEGSRSAMMRFVLTLGVAMERYVHKENIVRYRKLIAISEGDPSRDEVRYQTMLGLLAAELAKDKKPPND